MIDFNMIKKKGAVQLENECFALQDMLWEDPEAQRLADAIMSLRSLEEDNKFTLSEMLCGTVLTSFLRGFNVIFNTNEFNRLPSTLGYLITSLRYSILDDGYIRIVKAVIEEDTNARKAKTSKFFLTTDEDTDPIELTLKRLKQDGTLGFINPKLISVKKAYFGQVEKFTRMLEVFGDKENWDGFDFICEDRLESLLCFHEAKELLGKSVIRLS